MSKAQFAQRRDGRVAALQYLFAWSMNTPKNLVDDLRVFFEDIAEWGWPTAPQRRLLFLSDLPRLPEPLPRALPPDVDRALPSHSGLGSGTQLALGRGIRPAGSTRPIDPDGARPSAPAHPGPRPRRRTAG